MRNLTSLLFAASLSMVANTLRAESWTSRASLPADARLAPMSFALGGMIYLVGGQHQVDGSDYDLADCWEFNPTTNTWAQKADFGGGPISRGVGFAIGSLGYVGWGTTFPAGQLWAYDAGLNQWTQKASASLNLPTSSRILSSVFTAAGKGYVCGGLDTDPRSDLWEYDPTVDTWTQRTSFPGGVRYSAIAFTANAKGYYGTGTDGANEKIDLWSYDPATGGWAQVSDLPGDPRANASAFSIGTRGFVYGGVVIGVATFDDLWEFNALNGTWTLRASNVLRYLGTATSTNGKGYFGMGARYSNFNDWWEYTPEPQLDCFGVMDGPALPGATCDDDHAYTENDAFDPSCTCVGTCLNDYDGDGICDEVDDCPFQALPIGSPCDDYNACTENDVVQPWCGCYGTQLPDSDGDFYCDAIDNCPMTPGRLFDTCNDGDPTTVDDRIMSDCVCSGVLHPGVWTQKLNLPSQARLWATSTSVGGTGYLGSGQVGTWQFLNDWWAYDPIANAWAQKADLPTAGRVGAGAFTLNGQAYVFGGLTAQAYMNDLLRYDPASNTWTTMASLPGAPRKNMFAFTATGKAYVGAGVNPNDGELSDTWEYDPLTDSWAARAPYPFASYSLSSFSIGDTGYVGLGGTVQSQTVVVTSEFFAYSPATDAWVPRASLPSSPRLLAVGFAINGKGYAGTGGNNDIGGTPDLWEYDPNIDQWERKMTPPGGPKRGYATAFTIGAKGYLGTGWSTVSGANLSDLWEFEPNTECIIGSSCDDGIACTINDVLNANCTCAGTFQDADGDGICDAQDNCPNVPGQIGSPCNDNNANTTNDEIGSNCVCVGTPIGGCSTDLTLVFQTDGVTNIGWQIRQQNTNNLVQSGGGVYPPNPGYIVGTCVPDGCYYLVVTSDLGGIVQGGVQGGYILSTLSGDRLIDNRNNFLSGLSSQIAGGDGFCFPMATVPRIIYNSCDKLDWNVGPCDGSAPSAYKSEFIVADGDAAVSGDYPNALSGFTFWFYNPNGGYNFRRFRSHAQGEGAPVAANIRYTHCLLNNWAAANALQQNALYNVRVRAVVNNVPGEFGPACRMMLDQTAALCPATKLMDAPGHPQLSCGQSRLWGNGNYVYARPVWRYNNNCVKVNASRYRFRFYQPAEPYDVTLVSSTYYRQLNWNIGAGDPLDAGENYWVTVEASFNNGASYCPVGDSCLITMNQPFQGGGNQNIAIDGGTEPVEVRMYPNPNRGDQLYLGLDKVEDDVNTVSVDIYDLFGKRVSARTIAVQDGFINTVLELNGELAAGMYMVNITAGDATYTERLVIQP